jgi:hypothetical protein
MEPRAAAIQRGSVLFFRFLDVADELDLDHAESGLRRQSEVRRVQLRKESSAALALHALPLEVELGRRKVVVAPGREVDALARARLFPFGVVSIVFEADVAAGTTLRDLVPFAAAGWESATLDAAARGILKDLAPHLRAPSGENLYDEEPLIERYGIVFVNGVAGDVVADRDAVARLVLGEADRRALSAAAQDEALRQQFRYFEEDLVVVHTASALVLEPTGDRDVLLALELATAQLIELRTYDAMIDLELDRVYAELSRSRGIGWWLSGRRPRALSRRVQEQLLELAELADRAENAVKVASDLHLARIYLAAHERLQTRVWRESVSKKLALFGQVYSVLREESNAQRAYWIEVVIVVLIAFEIVMALAGR